MAMMEAADVLARKIRAHALITGESLGQVASQTAQTMRTTQCPTDFPVFRPLVGIDKEDTIQLAKKIKTFDISILPYEDCCVLFSPKHPLLRPDAHQQRKAYDELVISSLIEKSIENSEVFLYRYIDALTEMGIPRE
jgi:thiamine biosynthesis protein ThiI